MWTGAPGSGPWPQQPPPQPPQWPMQQAMYQNIPHEQVDWAALAQQWIQMREVVPGDQPPPPSEARPPGPNFQQRPMAPQYNTSGNGVMSSAPMHNRENTSIGNRPIMESRETVNHSDNSNSQDGSTYSQSGDWGYWQSGNWNANSNWAPPHPPENKDSVQTFEYGHMHGNQGYAAQTYDYNHGSDQCNFNQQAVTQAPLEQPGYNQYWMGQGEPPPFLRRDRKDDRFDREPSPVAEDGSPSSLDAAKRKNLPAWIREGLEKMEREKQKKIEYERMLKEREERLKMQREEEERVLKEMQEMAGRPVIPRKSKFESDSDNENSSSPVSGRRSPQFLKGNRLSPIRQRTPSPIEAPKTEQERLEQLMTKVRKMLTEILLEVTSEEIAIIAKETFMQAQAKAPAQQLAKSSALASITGSLGGLGGYGSDSEETGSEIENESAQVQRNPVRDREIVDYVPSDVSEVEDENELESKKTDDAKDVAFANTYYSHGIPSPSPNNKEMYHFEKKYEEIPGLDVPAEIDESETNTADSENKGASSERTVESAESERSSSSNSTLRSSSSSSTSKRSTSDASPKRREPVKGRETHDNKGEGRVGRSPNKSRSSNVKGKRESRSRSYDRARGSRNKSQERSVRENRNRSRSRNRDRSRSRNRGKSRSRSRNRDRRGSRRSRSSSRESGRRSSYRGNYFARRRKRSSSRNRSRRSPVIRRRRSVSRSRSRSRSPKSRSARRPSTRYSRSSSRDSSDHKMGKKSSRKPRL